MDYLEEPKNPDDDHLRWARHWSLKAARIVAEDGFVSIDRGIFHLLQAIAAALIAIAERLPGKEKGETPSEHLTHQCLQCDTFFNPSEPAQVQCRACLEEQIDWETRRDVAAYPVGAVGSC